MAVDGSLKFDTKVDTSGFQKGTNGIKQSCNSMISSFKKLGAAIGIAFGVAAIVNFSKESIKASNDIENAMMGLKSTVEGQGRSFKQANAFIQEYISDGLIPATDAATAYKNLAMRGYTDPQIEQTLAALKDSAAFGRQASLSLGQAVSSATEGLKNENSILVDNAGVTKNVSMMWKDYAKSIGVGVDSLTKQQKIQAEVLGIMEETRFQTGDAAKVADTYSGSILRLQFNLNNMKIAFGNFIKPIITLVLPTINAVITAFTKFFNILAQVSALLFGKKITSAEQAKEQEKAVGGTVENEKELAKAVDKTNKKLGQTQSGFDELFILSKKTEENVGDLAPDVPDLGGGGTVGGETELGGGGGVTISPEVEKFVASLKELLKIFDPIKTSLAALWEQLKIFGSFAWQGLVDFYELALKPIGAWVLGEGLPRLIDAITKGLAMIDWANINQSLANLWTALTPFAINVGEGLLWLWENVLVPLGTWVVNDVLPVFLDVLASGLGVLNDVIEALKPLGEWLWETFLKPLAEWTGGVIVEALNGLKDGLDGVSKWVTENQTAVENIAIVIGSFAVAWGLVTAAVAIWNVVAGIGAAVTAVLASPITLVVLAIGALIVIIVTLVKNWDKVTEVALSCWDWIKKTWTVVAAWFDKNVVQPVGKFFTGLWDGIANGAKMVWYGIQVGAISMVNFVTSVINAMIKGVLFPFNLLIDGLNLIPGVKIPNIGFEIPKISPPPMPKLARGAVLPPNREFMAIVGDQKHGTNIETPLATMIEAFETALNERGTDQPKGETRVQLILNGKPIGEFVIDYINSITEATNVTPILI